MRRALFAGVIVLSTVAGGVVGATNVVSVDGDNSPAIRELQVGTDALAADTDGDGVPDGREHDAGTDPTAADTDDDGVSDSDELRGATDPANADTDDDGLTDGRERDAGTDPTVADTDDDGLTDLAERQDHDTDPTAVDTDGDGLTDGRELDTYDTDPTVADTDDDGLTDGKETEALSNPTMTDTDGDGLTDGVELNEQFTDPRSADSDNDFLEDGAELHDHGTDPKNPDTDGDGLDDGVELNSEDLADADPLRMDVFVELDYMVGQKPSRDAIESVKQAYADAPVDNPDGTTGIDLHVTWGESVPAQTRINLDGLGDVMADHFDHEYDGYRYAVAVEDAFYEGEDSTGAARNAGGKSRFMFQVTSDAGTKFSEGFQASVFMHELGHSVGLYSRTYEGIDSRDVPYDEYRSVMNYNAPSDATHYSSAEPFDDWAYVAHYMYAPLVVPDQN